MNFKKILAACVLTALLGGTAGTYAYAGSLSDSAMQQQNVRASGVVVDAQGQPVPGASVIVKGTTSGTMTDPQGRFALSVNPGATLEVSCIGYATTTVAARENVRVVLSDDAEFLDEVVVVGYGTQKKANLTGAVSTVDVEKTLESKSTTSLGKALQGAVPGLTITNVNGDINGEPTIVIRGIGTLSNSGTSTPLYVVDGVPMDNLSYLNPQDIASISVLKDAASASIYGTRAAFGVVLVTTKSANTVDKAKVSYTNNFGWSQATMLPSYPTVLEQTTAMAEANARIGADCELFGIYFNSEEFIKKATEWQEKHGGPSGYRKMVFGDDYDATGYYADWDVAGIIFNNAAPSQNHTISVQGTSGKTNYYMSFGYDKEQSLMNFNPDKLKKHNATVNVSSQVKDWLQVGARVNYSDKNYTYPYLRSGTYQYLWRWGSFFGPYGWFEGEDGERYDGRTMIGYRNTGGDSYTKTDNLRLGTFAKIDILPGLTFNADYTYTYKTTRYKGVGLPAKIYNTWAVNPQLTTLSTTTFIETSRSFFYNQVANAYFNYQYNLDENNHFNFMAGANVDHSEYEYLYYERHAIADLNMIELALTNEDYSYTHSHTHEGSMGFFGRINYDYAGKYLAEFNIRRDGSSKFPEKDQWATFLSGSLGWRISDEAFFEPLKEHVNNAKLRLSYGEVGNQEVGSNMFLETMSKNTNAVNWLGTGSSKYDYFGMPKMVSESLTWESIATTNVGLDLGFLKGDLNVTLDWFQRDTRDMLAPGKALPQVLGASAAYENAGSLRTRGWEINVDWHHNFGEFSVYAIANLSDYKTKVLYWDSNNLINNYYTGKEYGEIWGFETDRYFESAADVAASPSQTLLESGKFHYGAGDIKFVDQDGNGVINWGNEGEEDAVGTPNNHGDLIKIGNTTPRYQYSLRIGGEWKGFDIDMYFQGVGKRDMWTQSAFVMPMMRGVDALYSNQTSYVTAQQVIEENVNQSADFPALYGGGAGRGNISSAIVDNGCYNFYPQTKYLVNMAYLRLKNVTVGYTLPHNLTDRVKIEKARVYFTGTNLLDIIDHTNGTGLDPEINTGTGSYANGVWGRTEPIYRTYSCGLQITF